MTSSADGPRLTQKERRSRTRAALLEAAARGLSTYGFANLKLEWVAGEAGFTRGALYHQFATKEELAVAVVSWVEETWTADVGEAVRAETDPLEALLTLARGHAVYCRRDVAGVLMTLRVEFAGQDHPVGQAMSGILDQTVEQLVDLITAARANGSLPPGPPPQLTAHAFLSALEGVTIEVAGQQPHDVEFAERTVRGVLGLPPKPVEMEK